MIQQLGDFSAGTSVGFKWNTFDRDGFSLTPTTTAATLKVYFNNTTTDTTEGITGTFGWGSKAGLNHCTIDTSQGVYSANNTCYAIIEGIVLDDQSINATLAQFSVQNRSAYVRGGSLSIVSTVTNVSTVATITNAVTVSTVATITNPVTVSTVATITNPVTVSTVSTITNPVLIQSGTGTGQLNFLSGAMTVYAGTLSVVGTVTTVSTADTITNAVLVQSGTATGQIQLESGAVTVRNLADARAGYIDKLNVSGTVLHSAFSLADGEALTADSIPDHLRKISWNSYNKMDVTEATGAYDLKKDDGVSTAATGTVTSVAGVTSRSAPTWA